MRSVVAGRFTWGEGERVELEGRHGTETQFPVIGR
jgi:hypothetical protein